MSAALRVKDIYDLSPEPRHQPGDIWHSLPTFGTLPAKFTPAIVITPACDLEQRKTGTITYLPIIPLATYFCLPSIVSEIVKSLNGHLAACKAGVQLSKGVKKYTSPLMSELNEAKSIVSNLKKSGKLGKQELQAADRALSALTIMLHIKNGKNICDLPGADVARSLGKWGEKSEKILKNATSDVHFLPRDEQPADWAAIPYHSVALFRNPLSLPVEILNLSQDSNINWPQAMKDLAEFYPVANEFANSKPMKKGTLRPAFASDMLTRYIGLYVRLGSPDYTDEMLSRFKSEIEGSK